MEEGEEWRIVGDGYFVTGVNWTEASKKECERGRVKCPLGVWAATKEIILILLYGILWDYAPVIASACFQEYTPVN